MADCTVTGQAVPGSTAAAAPPATGRVAPTVHSSACPPHVLEAIYGKVEDKKAALEHSLHRWWTGGRLWAFTGEVDTPAVALMSSPCHMCEQHRCLFVGLLACCCRVRRP